MSALRVKRGEGESGFAGAAVQHSIGGYGAGSGRMGTPAVSSSSPFSFDAALESSELEALLDRLYDVSAKLSVYPAARLIEEYRTVLTELLRRAAQGLRIKRDLRWRKTDRQMFVTIERTEDAMEELEEAFLYEGDRTKALALMEEIKGCLISLLM